MNAIGALLVNAYRELNSKKLFWITLVLSGLFVLVYGSIGFDESGISMFYGLWHVESEFINSETRWSRALYIGIFSDFVVSLWLAWVAIILALISTASIFPDFIAEGSIDLVLSKPMSRLKLFIVKYLGSLLFVLLQVALFCIGIFLCVGLRLGEWNWKIFAAIPIITIFFSYLYSVCVLIGVWTRSTLAALLLTMLFWFGVWTLQTTEGMLNQFRIRTQVMADFADEEKREAEQKLAELKIISEIEDDETFQRRADQYRERIDRAQSEAAEARDVEGKLATWHRPALWAMAILPKNAETVGLVSRWLKDPDGYSVLAMMRGDMTMGSNTSGNSQNAFGMGRIDRELNKRLEEWYDNRSPVFLICTSLLFELAVLSLAAWIFVRRDY